MKRKNIICCLAISAILCGCGEYDDSAIKSDISDLNLRVTKLEQQCRNMNENVSSLQTIIAAIQKQDGIVSVTDLPDNAGYAVLFTSGKTIYLHNCTNGNNGADGKNGADGHTPKISVRLDSDGIYYWTLDGEWLIVDGKKVKAVGEDGKDGVDGKDGENGTDGKDGKDGITPQLKIEEDGFWYITYDNGATWSKLGKAVGDNGKDGADGKDGNNLFKSVTIEDGYAIFVLNDEDQTTIKVPMAGTVSASTITNIRYVPDNLEGKINVEYFLKKGKPAPQDVTVKFEIQPQDAVDHIVENWKDVLVAKAVYVPSTKAEFGDFVTLNINDVAKSEDNTIVVTLDTKPLDDKFFSTETPAGACLRLSVKTNGKESVSSDYLPMMPYKINVSLSVDVKDITSNEAIIFGNLVVDSDKEYEKNVTVYYSDQFSTVEKLCSDGTSIACTLSEDGGFSATLSELNSNTKINYIAIATVNEAEYPTNVKSFVTEKPQPSGQDMSTSGTANCYIVSESGNYKFKTVKGNSSESVGLVDNVEVLWETFGTSTKPNVGDLIYDVTYGDGYIGFTATDKKGNALIAAKNERGDILWSWHIWLTDQPQDQVYRNDAGTMMDRNIGATSARKGDVGALGLLYQWGRKDPFLGGCRIGYSSYKNQEKATSTLTWPKAVRTGSLSGTIAYAIAHPTTFIRGEFGGGNKADWLYSNDYVAGSSRWKSEKTIYDPCPVGYRVPDTGVWLKASGHSGSYFETMDNENKGIDFALTVNKFGFNVSSIWYPNSGYLSYESVSLYSVGELGYYWSCNSDDSSNFSSQMNISDSKYVNVNPSSNSCKAFGYSVRCLKESK